MPSERTRLAATPSVESAGLSQAARVPPARQAPRADAITFDAINGWRGPSAITIALAHLAAATDFIAFHSLRPIALVVDLFFVLSGLLIAHAYMEKLRNLAAILDYVIRRFGRIWPVQAVTLAVLLAYEALKLVLQVTTGKQFSSPPFSPDGMNTLAAVPTNLLLIHSLGIHDRETWNFPSWSLSVEFATYLVFALVCLASPLTRRMLAVVIVMASMIILIVVAPYHMRSTFDFGIFRCLAGFFAGTLCYEILRKWPVPPLPPSVATLIEGAAIAMLVGWLSVAVGSAREFAAPFVICLFAAAFLPGRGFISRVLKARALQVLADLSFPIYMVHGIVVVFFLACLHEIERFGVASLFTTTINPLAGHAGATPTLEVLHVDNIWVKLAITLLYVVAVLILSIAIHRYAEIPGRLWFNRLAKRVAARPPLWLVGVQSPRRPAEPAR